MLSRAADNLYWMSRYLERAEHTARLIDVDLQLRLDQSPEAGAGRWRFLLEALRTPATQDSIDPTLLVDSLVFSRRNSSSIVSCIASPAITKLRQFADFVRIRKPPGVLAATGGVSTFRKHINRV